VRRLDSTHSVWLFDEERRRFRRLPHGFDPDGPALESDWQPYFALEVDEAAGSFTVRLDPEGSRFLRAFLRAPAGAAPGAGPGVDVEAARTTELRLGEPERSSGDPPDASSERSSLGPSEGSVP
jgi:hypothetical protein